MEYWVRAGLRVVVVVAWLLLAGDAAIPDRVWALQAADSRFALGVAAVGSVVWVMKRMALPVRDVFDSGRAFERARVEAERGCARVVPITGRRQMQQR